MEDDWRNREINLHKDYLWLLRVTRGAVLLGIGILLGIAFYADPASRQAYAINVFTSVLGLGATALIFDELNRKRSRDELKRQLVDDAASISNEIAKNAVHQLRRKGWLEGENGLLKGADLSGANLQGAYLHYANLQGAKLTGATLERANLMETNLKGVDLGYANLQEARLGMADLQGARLVYSNLQAADFEFAKLGGVHLRNAFLRRADVRWAHFDESTSLPDDAYNGPSRWTTGTDMSRFTDPNHLDFWQPEWVKRQTEGR